MAQGDRANDLDATICCTAAPPPIVVRRGWGDGDDVIVRYRSVERQPPARCGGGAEVLGREEGEDAAHGARENTRRHVVPAGRSGQVRPVCEMQPLHFICYSSTMEW